MKSSVESHFIERERRVSSYKRLMKRLQRTRVAEEVAKSIFTSPSILIVGFQKCGTTSLYKYITSTEEYVPGKTKEKNTFAQEKYSYAEYLLNFPPKYKGYKTVNASHQAIFVPGALERVKKHLNQPKVLVIMRNPVNRAYSHFAYDVEDQGYIDQELSFDDYVEYELDLLKNVDLTDAKSIYNHTTFYSPFGMCISKGIYVTYLKRLKELDIPFHAVFLEELRDKPEETWKGIATYCGLEKEMPEGMIRTNFNQGKYKSPISDATREKLNAFYAPFNEELSSFLNRETPW